MDVFILLACCCCKFTSSFSPVPVTPLFSLPSTLWPVCVCARVCVYICIYVVFFSMCVYVCPLLPAPLRRAKFVESPRIPQSELGSPTHTFTTAKNPDLDTHCRGKFFFLPGSHIASWVHWQRKESDHGEAHSMARCYVRSIGIFIYLQHSITTYYTPAIFAFKLLLKKNFMIVITSIKSCLKVDYKIKIHNLHSCTFCCTRMSVVIKLTSKDSFLSRGFLAEIMILQRI